MRYAAIDCGTNSIRLLVADVVGRSVAEVWRDLRIVRLGEGVDRTGEFAPDALARTFAACREYRAKLAELGSPPLVFAATSASRDVSNRAAFVAGVTGILGVVPEVISGRREAELSFIGATWELPPTADPVLVFDIGGGSTEIIRGSREARRIDAAISVDLGCVRLTERHRDDQRLAADIAAGLDRAAAVVDLAGAGTVVGLSGTVTTVAALAMGLDSYDPALVHHARISVDTITRVVTELAALSGEQRAALPAMHPGRGDVIVAGGRVLVALLERTGASELLVSEADILDGLVLAAAQVS